MKPFLPLLLLAVGCASTSERIPDRWARVPAAERIAGIDLDAEGKVSRKPLLPLRPGVIRVVNNRLVNGEKPITAAFAAVESFDVSESRGEVVFSAKRDASFDIGLAATDGSATNWIPADPADEVHVEWAPRGNKVSYFVRAPLGDIVRTFHVPTSYQYALDFGHATLNELGWDPQAERFAVSYSTVDGSDRVEVMRYDGTDRRVAVQPARKVAADVLPFSAATLALRPHDPLYSEKFPVVVWVAERFDWSDARAALLQEARVAVLVTTRPPGAELWKTVEKTPWLDSSRVFVVGVAAGAGAPPAVSIVPDASLPEGSYRRTDSSVAVSPAAIQSFAAGFIADQWKRTSAPNGSSR